MQVVNVVSRNIATERCMKVILQSLLKSFLVYGFFLIFSIMAVIKTSQLSVIQFLGQFWHDYGLLFIILHALYILAFVSVQGRVNWINQHPPSSLDKQRAKQIQRTANTWLGRAGAAFLFSVVGLIGLIFYFANRSAGYAFAIPSTLLLLFLLLVASGLNILIQNYLHFLRKRLAKTVDEVLSENKAPVLYLRSFLDDTVAAKREVTLLTEEEELNKAFEHIGPMIAIGRPGETLPEVGAARAYFTDDKWQAAVHHYMDISCLIVLRAGLSQGLIWEIQNSIQRLDPSKLILLIPFEKEAYDQFRTRVQSLFPKPLPDHPGHDAHRMTINSSGKTEKRIYGSLLGLIHFDDDWTAHFEKICADNVPVEYQMIGNQLVDKMNYLMVHYALRPVYTRLGLAWDDLGVPWKNL
jgi:Holliday junction resolvase-like predicted endonuclease